jgi:hypothetical protein
MGSSSSSDRRAGHLRVTVRPLYAEIEILDFALRTVGVGVGELEIDLPDGIYEVIGAVGTAMTRRLVRVRSAERIGADLRIDDPTSVAPAPGSSTWTEDAIAATERLSEWNEGAGDSAIALLFREAHPRVALDGTPSVRLEASTVLNVEVADDEWVNGPGWRGWSGRIGAGGYLVHAATAGPGELARTGVSVPVWLSSGWTTLCFFETDAESGRVRLVSIQTSRRGQSWRPHDLTTLSLEAVLTAEASGRTLSLPNAHLSLEASANPNLLFGLVAAQTILKRPDPDFLALSSLLAYLEHEIPDHPDLLALQLFASLRLDEVGDADEKKLIQISRPDAIRWPPSLAWIHERMIERDAYEPGTVVPESTADSLCPTRLRAGFWTTYGMPVAVEAASATASDAVEEDGFGLSPSAPPEVRLVMSFLARFSRVQGISAERALNDVLDVPTIAWSTGLTTAAVRRALDDTSPGIGGGDRSPLVPSGPFVEPDRRDEGAVIEDAEAAERKRELVEV